MLKGILNGLALGLMVFVPLHYFEIDQTIASGWPWQLHPFAWAYFALPLIVGFLWAGEVQRGKDGQRHLFVLSSLGSDVYFLTYVWPAYLCWVSVFGLCFIGLYAGHICAIPPYQSTGRKARTSRQRRRAKQRKKVRQHKASFAR